MRHPSRVRNLHVLFAALTLLSSLVIAQMIAQAGQQIGEPTPRPHHDPALFSARVHPMLQSASGELPAQSASTLADDWNKIVFQSYRDGNWELYLRGFSDTAAIRLTNEDRADIQPRLNRQTDRIVYAAKTRNSYQIFSRSLDGSSESQLTRESGDSLNPVWSPDSTQILYQYRVGEAYNIYKMNADGSNKVPLTNDPIYSGEPSWSPDGTKVAFVAYRNDGYRIWVMNADGSNQAQLSSQPYASQPVWSSDGTKIAYSADWDGDGFLSLMVMQADGGNQHVLVHGGGTYDILAYSWNTGSSMIAATALHWIEIGGEWYWDSAEIIFYDMDLDTTAVSLESMGLELPLASTDMSPDWQSLDRLPPTASLSGPAIAPYSYAVGVSADDAGGSGIAGYYIQYKHNLADPWQYFLYYGYTRLFPPEPTFQYWGVGGQITYFRVSARDNVGNIGVWPENYQVAVMVENLPPESSVDHLPAYSPRTFQVSWGGFDHGGSGIENYDVQYRNGPDGEWLDWLTDTTDTQALFNGSAGSTYYFRTRSRDKATNEENWPVSEFDTLTTVYAVGVSGTVTDNYGNPVSGAVMSTDPPLSGQVPSDRDGRYQLFIVPPASSYSASFSKDGYAPLPAAPLPDRQDTVLDIVLPPVDDLVLDGHFESGALAPNWQAGGTSLPVALPGFGHTGQTAVRMTDFPETIYSEYPVAGDIMDYNSPYVFVGPDQRLHIAWKDYNEWYWYAYQTANGGFSTPELLCPIKGCFNLKLIINADGSLHAVWKTSDWGVFSLYYRYRSSSGIWSQPEQIDDSANYTPTDSIIFLRDAGGGLHLIWGNYTVINYSGRYSIRYSHRSGSGSWSPPMDLPGATDLSWFTNLVARLDSQGGLHVAWIVEIARLNYSYLEPGGTWSAAEDVETSSLMLYAKDLYLGLDSNDKPFVVWNAATGNYANCGLQYQARNPDGTWSPPTTILESRVISLQLYKETATGILYTLVDDEYGLRLYSVSSTGTLTELDALPSYNQPGLLLDQQQRLYLAWEENYMTHISRWNFDGSWTHTDILPEAYLSGLVLTGPGVPHMFWNINEGMRYLTYTLAPVHSQSILEQPLTIPLTMTAPVLSFMYNLSGRDVGPGNWFKAEVISPGSTTALFETASQSNGWQHGHYSMEQWLGQSVTLRFSAAQAAYTRPIWAYLDEVSLGASNPDVWIEIDHPLSALPGELVDLEIRYANQGAAPAHDLVITTLLPTSLVYVSSSQPPTITGEKLEWVVPDLEGSSQVQTISLTVRIQDDVPLWSILEQVITISTAPGEIETGNNTFLSRLPVYFRVHLPDLSR